MRNEYDFSKAKPNPYIKKLRRMISIRIDIDTTMRLIEVGKILGIPLLDHIIMTNQSYYSMKENGYIYWQWLMFSAQCTMKFSNLRKSYINKKMYWQYIYGINIMYSMKYLHCTLKNVNSFLEYDCLFTISSFCSLTVFEYL